MVVELAWLIPALPTAAFVVCLTAGGRLPARGGSVAVALTGGSLLLSGLVLLEALGGVSLATGQPRRLAEEPFEASVEWLRVGGVRLEAGVLVDTLAAVMAVIVSLVSTLILVYSLGYMAREEGLPRYYATMSLFIASMLGLVLANNFLLLYIFWELVGLCSYLLIGFWYHKPSAAAAAKKAFLVTRLGDVLLLVGIFVVFHLFGTLNFLEIQARLEGFDPRLLGLLTLSTALIFGGAQGKSAQFPLHVWLPDAMEGPTTVSALIHAATMVKAGVYLVARSYPLFVATPDALLYVALIGAFTAFIAATMATVATDMKRIIAYSTMSQIGYMMAALGVGAVGLAIGFTAALFHLLSHAFFKALFFLSAGSVLHATGLLDITRLGGLASKMRLTALAMLVAALANSGLPPFNGFFSKDEVLAAVLGAGALHPLFNLVFLTLLATAFLTAFYSFRLWLLIFTGRPRSHFEAHEAPRVMTVPLMALTALATVGGVFLFAGEGFGAFVFFREPHPVELSPALAATSAAVAAVGALLAYGAYYRRRVPVEALRLSPLGRALYAIPSNKWWMDHLYYGFAERVVHAFARAVSWFDLYGVDGIVNGLGRLLYWSGRQLPKAQSGVVSDYAAAIAVGLSVLILVLILLGVV